MLDVPVPRGFRAAAAISAPNSDKALIYLRPGDTFVITRLSRAARSLRHLLDLRAQLREREVDPLASIPGKPASV